MNSFHKLLIICTITLGSSICYAQYSDRELYDAYLRRDMPTWASYIASVDTAQADNTEKLRMLNYLYGYTAYAVSIKQSDARQLLDLFEANLHNMRHLLPEAEYLSYKVSASSYELSLNHWLLAKYSKEIYQDINRAISLSPDDPLVLTMKGNVEFYNPLGSKQAALLYFQKADSIYHTQDTSPYLWNVRAVQMTLVQCIEKTSGKQEAIRACYEILKEEPNFSFIRDSYLPSLEK